MREVENKWSTLKLNDDIWAKLIYFEKNRRLAKAYVSAPVLTIDGSTNGLDGFRIGLSGIDNTYRSLESVACLRSIGHGIKLKIDSQGNILIRKIGVETQSNASQCSVWVKDWPSSRSQTSTGYQHLHHSSASFSSSSSNSLIRKIDFSDSSYKLFDMRKFRLLLEKSRLRRENNRFDWRQCVSIISFVRASQTVDANSVKQTNILDDPCWLMLINIIAIDMLKSSFYSERLPMRCHSSSLIQNHSLLESNNRMANNNLSLAYERLSSRRLTNTSSSSYQVSSSTTNLAPSTASSVSQGKSVSYLAKESHGRNLGSLGEPSKSLTSAEKVKKTRTSVTRQRYSNNKLNYRRYMSTQQLSNNTIYTTFNSKYINSSHLNHDGPLYDAPSSGYNSSSRGGSTGCWQLRRHLLNRTPLDAFEPNQMQLHSNHQEDFRFTRRFERSKERGNNSGRSVSVVDLSRQSLNKPIGLSALGTSIKMNYDYPSDKENEEERYDNNIEEVEDEGDSVDNKQLEPKSELKLMDSTTKCRCEHKTCFEAHKTVQDPGQIDHNECEAVHGRMLTKPKLEPNGQQEPFSNAEDKKISRSSIASSSSSSGCPDNDYFMSQSSSSMSSSTTSNPSERDQFSQPASSSGIGGSNSTCDEYDDSKLGRSITVTTKLEPVGTSRVLRGASSAQMLKDVNHKHQNQHLSPFRARGCKYNKNHLRSEDTDCCCNHDSAQVDEGSPEVECDCSPVDSIQCDCCDCDCISMKSHRKTAPNEINLDSSCNECKDEAIYDVLPVSQNKLLAARRSEEHRTSTLIAKDKQHQGVELDSEQVKSVPTLKIKGHKSMSSEKPPKHSSGGWLERKKYSKMLPKFIFSASGTGNNTTKNDHCQQAALSGI